MNTFKIIESLQNKGVQFTETEKILICESFQAVNLKKNDFLIRQGEIEQSLYYIEKGAVRYWFENDKAEEITFWFSFEEEFCNAYVSMIKHQACEFNIQALEDLSAWKIDNKVIECLYNESLATNISARIILEDVFVQKLNREMFMLKYKPKDRYLILMEHYAEKLHRIPLKYLASYLGITPQSLSRIRKNIYHKKV